MANPTDPLVSYEGNPGYTGIPLVSYVGKNVSSRTDSLVSYEGNQNYSNLSLIAYVGSNAFSVSDPLVSYEGLLSIFPNPTQQFNFLSGSLPSNLTFSRASQGSYYNSSGIVNYALANTPRFDYNPSTLALNGLLLEGQATNLIQYSQTFSNSYWTFYNANYTTASLAPDGTNTAANILSTVNNTVTGVIFGNSFSVTEGLTYTHSAYLKAGTTNQVVLGWTENGVDYQATFDLTAGTIIGTSGMTATIQPINAGWYRCVVTRVVSTATSINVFAYDNLGLSGQNYYYWGAQCELGVVASSYIPTAAATVTRASDVLTGATSSYFNASAGSMTVQALKSYNDLTYAKDVQFDDGTDNNRQVLYANQATYDAASTSAGTGTYINGLGNITYGTPYKSGMSWNSSGVTACFNGGTVQTASASLPTNITTLRFSDTTIDNNPMNGWLQSFKYWNTALTNSQLQQVT